MQHIGCTVGGKAAVVAFITGAVGVAANHDGVHILGAVAVGKEVGKANGQLIQHGLAVGLQRGGASVKQHTLAEHQAAGFADGDGTVGAQDTFCALPDFLHNVHPQEGCRLHLPPHLGQLCLGIIQVFLLLRNPLLLLFNGCFLTFDVGLLLQNHIGLLDDAGVLTIQLHLLIIQILAGSFQIIRGFL